MKIDCRAKTIAMYKFAIADHNLKLWNVVDWKVEKGSHARLYNVVGAATIDEDGDRLIVDVARSPQGLW